MGPTGFLPASSDPAMSRLGFADLVPVYQEQAAALIEGGVDVLIVETQQDILETRPPYSELAPLRLPQAGPSRS